MAEYIAREAAKEELVSWARYINDPKYLITDDAMCVLDGMKTADVVEVVHGNWVEGADGAMHCSRCFRVGNPHTDNYCPNCGAIMDGE